MFQHTVQNRNNIFYNIGQYYEINLRAVLAFRLNNKSYSAASKVTSALGHSDPVNSLLFTAHIQYLDIKIFELKNDYLKGAAELAKMIERQLSGKTCEGDSVDTPLRRITT